VSDSLVVFYLFILLIYLFIYCSFYFVMLLNHLLTYFTYLLFILFQQWVIRIETDRGNGEADFFLIIWFILHSQ